jgi:hypothetical protein
MEKIIRLADGQLVQLDAYLNSPANWRREILPVTLAVVALSILTMILKHI